MRRMFDLLRRTAELMVGVPDYDRYLAIQRRRPGAPPPLDRKAFHRNRTARRHGADGGRAVRCC